VCPLISVSRDTRRQLLSAVDVKKGACPYLLGCVDVRVTLCFADAAALPDLVLQNIFEQSSFQDLARIACVSKRFQQIAATAHGKSLSFATKVEDTTWIGQVTARPAFDGCRRTYHG